MELSVICHSEVPESASRTSGECRESEEGGREGERERGKEAQASWQFQSADLAVTRANWHLTHNKDIYEPARFNYEEQKKKVRKEERSRSNSRRRSSRRSRQKATLELK